MKKYTLERPRVKTYIQWDGTNIAEFEAMTGEDWTWLYFNTPTYVDNAGELEIWTAGVLIETVPNGYWTAGPGQVTQNLENTPTEYVLEGNPLFHYMVEED